MDLREVLVRQGNTEDEVNIIISDMVSDIENGCDPEEVLFDYGLEPDYVFDLLEECM